MSGVRNYQKAIVECLSEVDILHSTYRIVEHDLEVFGKEAEIFDSDIWHKMDSFLDQFYFTKYVESFFQLFHQLTKH
jgi:archaellum component FlaC